MNGEVTSFGHGLEPGDIVSVSGRSGLRMLLSRPRVRYVSAVSSPNTFTLAERRMTWSEWRAAIWAAIRRQ